MMTNRRGFLQLGVASLAGAGAAVAPAKRQPSAVRLKIGILSDIHLRLEPASKKLVRALEFFRNARVDGVLICGDLADSGIVPQLEELARIWEKVFPDSKGLDGEHVEKLFHYGDHDNRGYVPQGGLDAMKRNGWTDDQCDENLIFKHPKEVWERIFGEPWSPLVHKRIKGYDFILANFTRQGWSKAEGLEDFMKVFHPDPDKPFFYSQHRVLRNTVCGPGVWGQDHGVATRVLSGYPNCFAFCGHSHQTAVREDSIWQGAFTAVQVPSLYYVTQEDGHANKPNGFDAEQGMLLSVYDDLVKIYRLDFASGKALAGVWNVPLALGERPYAHEMRRRKAERPEFPAGAELVARMVDKKGADGKSCRTLHLEFPVVNGLGGGVRAYDYEVTVDALCFGGDAQRMVRRFFSPNCQFAPSADTGTVKVELPLGEFKKWNSLKARSWGALHVSVRPREIFGGTGAAIEADVR